MYYRQICITLLSSAFLLGSPPALQAMEDDEKIHSSSSLSKSENSRSTEHDEDSSESSSDSYHSGSERLTLEELKIYKQIKRVKNPIPETNSDLDEIQNQLASPIKAEVPYTGNSTIFLALLENGTKVLIKKSMVARQHTHYSLEQAISEFVAPKIARAYFDRPTLLPSEFISGEDGQFEVRQYFIDGELLNGNLKRKQIHMLIDRLHKNPQQFNRSPHFWFDLELFDDFIAAADRNNTQFFWFPYQNIRNRQQNLGFFAIDYAEIFYHSVEGIVDKDHQGDSVGSICGLQQITLLSSLKKLNYLYKIYPSFFKEAESLRPGVSFFDNADSPFAVDNSHYFESMATWHQDLFRFYQGYTVDDMDATWGIMVNSHKLNKK